MVLLLGCPESRFGSAAGPRGGGGAAASSAWVAGSLVSLPTPRDPREHAS